MKDYPNLIPNSERTPEQLRAMCAKGGRMSTPKKRLAAQIRELKKKGLDNEGAKVLANIMEHPEVSALDIFKYIQSIKKSAKTANEKTQLAKVLLDWHAKFHGSAEKRSPDVQINIQQNVMTVEKKEELIRNLIGTEVVDS